MNFHLAHVNIAWMYGSIGEPLMSGLARRMDKINWLAEEIKGFLWRLAASQVTYEALDAFKADFPGFRRERLFYNMSV